MNKRKLNILNSFMNNEVKRNYDFGPDSSSRLMVVIAILQYLALISFIFSVVCLFGTIIQKRSRYWVQQNLISSLLLYAFHLVSLFTFINIKDRVQGYNLCILLNCNGFSGKNLSGEWGTELGFNACLVATGLSFFNFMLNLIRDLYLLRTMKLPMAIQLIRLPTQEQEVIVIPPGTLENQAVHLQYTSNPNIVVPISTPIDTKLLYRIVPISTPNQYRSKNILKLFNPEKEEKEHFVNNDSLPRQDVIIPQNLVIDYNQLYFFIEQDVPIIGQYGFTTHFVKKFILNPQQH
ncbi:hypothetical protein PPL_12403 [Heterostelium album PN500]|uniref:Transmembrane protein n=1 Tax=Heterostelium pallidum (strain ATCC 26659 / Pp 5 / PN500) TaxID=670386 RepID=D3BMI3_HETP5|nr:hypothetical protein PPL_12403 [Heterostelium album PN500]EFA77195.1 hypothetical protein PPL_12403 [Heterostelium album PN500]|eukprot:XP_020429324.1 hypothetical protein PPL_12403 [Heterostelium album PN500]